jgi:GT2 family glycosyltransferase
MASGVQGTAVCALTCRRPAGLERLLAGLASLRYSGERPDVRVIIVDNDPEGSARTVCAGWEGRLGARMLYLHEPRPGIPVARNRALDAVDRRIERIAFIDDDEVPHPDWLDQLILAQQAYDADVVTGPVDRRFEVPPPAWVKRGRFFERSAGLGPRPGRLTGEQLSEAYTNNVMFRASLLDELGLRFDERYGFGEDSRFFRHVARAGCRIVWVEEARVVEWMPAERATERWLIDRRYRSGILMAMLERDELERGREVSADDVVSVRRVVGLARKAAVGGLASGLAAIRLVPRHTAVRGRGKVAFALGFLEAATESGNAQAAGRIAGAAGPALLARRFAQLMRPVLRRLVWPEDRGSGEGGETRRRIGR